MVTPACNKTGKLCDINLYLRGFNTDCTASPTLVRGALSRRGESCWGARASCGVQVCQVCQPLWFLEAVRVGCSPPSVQLLGMLHSLGCCTQHIPGRKVLKFHSMAPGKSKIAWILPATGRFSRTVCDYIKQHKVTFALGVKTFLQQ